MRSSMRSKFIDTIRHFFTGDQPAYSAIDIFQLGVGRRITAATAFNANILAWELRLAIREGINGQVDG